MKSQTPKKRVKHLVREVSDSEIEVNDLKREVPDSEIEVNDLKGDLF